MGMDAKAMLWYGVTGDSLPESARLEIEEPEDGPWDEKIIEGVHITTIYSGDIQVGTGGILAFSWWGEKLKPVPLSDLEHIQEVVNNFLDDYNVPGSRGLYLAADFS